MPLPDLIEILPQTTPVTSHITVPGSKSITNRALILAALANGETTLTGALWSEDTQIIMTEKRETFGEDKVIPQVQMREATSGDGDILQEVQFFC